MPEVIIPGPEGRIEARYHHHPDKNAPLALVLHPHPQYGGTMNNKVVYNMYQTFAECGFSVLRFNFRGVGRSQGSYDEGIGEMTDAASVLDWLQQQNSDASVCWIAGFSFGAWIAMQLLMRRPELEAFVAASPPANLYDFSFLTPCPASGLITMGDKDDVVSEDSVSKLASRLVGQQSGEVKYEVISGADHYYRNHLDTFNGITKEYINQWMEEFLQRRKIRPDKKRRQLPRD